MTATLSPRIGRTPFVLSTLLALVALGAGIAALARPDLIHGPAVSVGSLRGTALIIVLVAVPLLGASMAAVRAGSLLGLLGWLGATAFIGYQSVLFLFGSPFNGLFPLFVGMLSFAGWTLIALAPGVPVGPIAARFGPRTPVRLAAGYLAVMAFLFYVLWLRAIVPALFASEAPAFLAGTGMTTGPGQVMDLAFLLPLCLLAARWVAQRRPVGFVVAGSLLVMLAVEAASIAVDQWFGSTADPTSTVASASMVPVFVLVTLVGNVVLVLFLRGAREAAPKDATMAAPMPG